MITIATSKGYILDETIPALEKAGFHFADGELNSRKLFAEDREKRIRLLQVRPWDVPVYVEQGAADLGICGHDVLLENPTDTLKLADLDFGYCELVLAAPEGTSSHVKHNAKIATKYVRSTEAYFRQKGIKIRVIKLYGAIELAPITGIANFITDLSATGKTLKEHHLAVHDILYKSRACIIANPASMRFAGTEIGELLKVLVGNAI